MRIELFGAEAPDEDDSEAVFAMSEPPSAEVYRLPPQPTVPSGDVPGGYSPCWGGDNELAFSKVTKTSK